MGVHMQFVLDGAGRLWLVGDGVFGQCVWSWSESSWGELLRLGFPFLVFLGFLFGFVVASLVWSLVLWLLSFPFGRVLIGGLGSLARFALSTAVGWGTVRTGLIV